MKLMNASASATFVEAVGWHGQYYSAEVTLPPLAGLWLVPEDEDDE